MEEKKEAKVDYETHSERVAKLKAKVSEAAFAEKKKGVKVPRMSKEMQDLAEATISLMQTPAFKEYMRLESIEIARALRNAFAVPVSNPELERSSPVIKKSYGEQMAFNEGLYKGLLIMKSSRDRLWNTYLNMEKEE